MSLTYNLQLCDIRKEKKKYLIRRKHKRRLRKKDIVKRRIIITASLFCLTFMLVIGYSVFNTNINLSVKGNIYNKKDLCFETSDNGDGTNATITWTGTN